MNSIIKLRSDDFSLEKGAKGKILCNGIKGISVCMFWSPGCKICQFLEPKFRKLPQIINGVHFCLLNINENQEVITLSKDSIAPIEYVPYICVYINARPFLLFDDEPTLEKIINFVQYTMKLVETKKNFIDKGNKVESDIPAYSIAKPYAEFKCDDTGFCYLSFTDAYPRNAAAAGPRPST